MGFKLDGFVCNGCAVFQQYECSISSLDGSLEYSIPDGWKITSNHTTDNNWVKTNGKELILYCDKCSRSLKINKIQHDLQKKEGLEG